MVREGHGVPFHVHEESDIRHQKVKLRMLILYLVTIALLVWLGITQQQSDSDRRRFEQAVVANCMTGRANTVNFNALIDTVIDQVSQRTGIPPAERARAIRSYNQARQTVPDCPPRR